MSVDWEKTFRDWSKPSSDREEEKAINAIRMVKDAIRNSDALSKRKITIFLQGSYKNNTNVKLDSDVDICICCNELIISDYSKAPNINDEIARLSPATYTYEEFKNDIKKALVNKFGNNGITEGGKAFDIHENTYRIDADVVPAIERRLYKIDGSYHQGTQILSKSGVKINNWPNQNYINGVKKNILTNQRFKFITRVIKRLRNDMVKENIDSAKPIPSYLIECLVYLVPDVGFADESYIRNVNYCLGYLDGITENDIYCKKFKEINHFKYLFHSSQNWNNVQVNDFLNDALNYINAN